jgi:hypothetical protein
MNSPKVKKVITRKLGRERADGQAHKHNGVIEIDSRLKGKRLLETLIHETMHIINPFFTEEAVEAYSKEMTRVLWNSGFRKTDAGR